MSPRAVKELRYSPRLIYVFTGVNFTNVLRSAFPRAGPKSVKKTVKFSIFFTLSGSTSVKAIRRMMMKLTPGWELRDIL